VTLQLVRQIRGHWSTSETAPQWLADVVLDLSIFMPSILTTTFAANAVVLSGGGGVYFVGTGGAPESYGTAPAAFVTQAGPYNGPIIGANAQGTIAANGPRVLHLVAASTDGQPVEIDDVVLTIEGEAATAQTEGQPTTAMMDLSESGVTAWLPLVTLLSSIDCSWPDTGSPHGTLSIELTSDPTDTTRVAMAPGGVTLSGVAGRACFDLGTCEPYARVRYTWSLGGGGAALTIVVNEKPWPSLT